MTLYHYTCDDGRAAIGDVGVLVPGVERIKSGTGPWSGLFVWLTDLTPPDRDALGLTSHLLGCDRTQHRYRVTDETGVRRWCEVARYFTREARESLERAPGARPAHWWVSREPVPVVLDSPTSPAPVTPRVADEHVARPGAHEPGRSASQT